MQKTPRANRIHIGIFGKRNTGKSSLLNKITDQEVALVSDFAGTTTDPVYKNMEIPSVGPVVFIDTAGFDDVGELGELRIQKTKEAIKKCDIALFLFSKEDLKSDIEYYKDIKSNGVKMVPVLSKIDTIDYKEDFLNDLKSDIKEEIIFISSNTGDGIDNLIARIKKESDSVKEKDITGKLVKEDSLVLLVMPIDIQAPKGRLILPQVQTIREILDKKSVVISVTLDKLDLALKSLNRSPDIIITDSQAFKEVYDKKPEDSLLTSFSVLFASYKGDIDYFVESTKYFEKLNENSKVLIAEACTHPPLEEDIGRVKIPRMLRKKYGENMEIDFVRGDDFPDKLDKYDLVIHCGACMFNRKHVLSRLDIAKLENTPMTNYGITIAYMKGILGKVSLP